MSTKQDPEALFLELLPRLESLIRKICFRHRMREDERQELRSEVFVHLIDKDYHALRSFGGRSSIDTYLTTVIHRLLVDRRYRREGRWRPSTAARRLGPVAVRLETLTHREGLSAEEAIEIILAATDRELSRCQVQEIWRRLPARPPQRNLGEHGLDRLPSALQADCRLDRQERVEIAQKVQNCLRRAFQSLGPEDRLVLALRYRDGISVQRIATLLKREARPLYRLCDRVLRRLRQNLLEAGLDWPRVREILGWKESEIGLDFNIEERVAQEPRKAAGRAG